ncbi:[FeFe] hydrogenase H-cluster radical SAM maturase HydE [Paraferrimonas haliotis]|uniref:[FeFe] hydrogenase H-cluster radical SAM maturase HydE n=1 Tax=Paraferrimonas haliotis TaxID=2013866 RepID=A0AA37WX89_9GAMM|nr:[FeFe] hydrogenase H-cluster radical SAM maturase HydE [Paraferrimonas haliotis]GLS82220.1 [FeFe] hydrogenase H-cluster radical SAM maturase HydE [Paraferrimonas haliotis]
MKVTTSSFISSQLTKQQIKALLLGDNDQWLFQEADRICRKVFDNQVYLRGIVEFSNYCRQHCHYCGLRSNNRNLERYRLTEKQILAAVDNVLETGLKTIVLQSGDDSKYSMFSISRLIDAIKQRDDVAVTLSLGERRYDEYQQWRQDGADRYLLKMETFNRQKFNELRPKSDFDKRLEHLSYLKELGYQVGSGIIVGLPGITIDSLVNDLIALTALELDMIACGPFVAHSDTPLCSNNNGQVLLSHRVTAILRLMNPLAHIPATSSLEVLDKGARTRAITRGCNIVMPSFTPTEVFTNYTIYPGKNASTLTIEQRLEAISQQIQSQGLNPTISRGDSKRKSHVSRY